MKKDLGFSFIMMLLLSWEFLDFMNLSLFFRVLNEERSRVLFCSGVKVGIKLGFLVDHEPILILSGFE